MLATLAVIDTLPPRLKLADDNCTVTPVGTPVAASATLELNPFADVMEMVVAADVPAAAVILAGDALSANVVAVDTVSIKVAVLEMPPLVPLMVIE